jgi:hypothetical protein
MVCWQDNDEEVERNIQKAAPVFGTAFLKLAN